MSVLRSMRPFLFTAAALGAPIPALAQDVTEATETVVVSTSRISLKGYEAPTPVTEIGLEKIERDAKMDIGDLIREMPATGASPSLNNGGNAIDVSQGDAGLDTVSLRNLGIGRTLVLFDGQRVVSSNLLGGGVDLSTLPVTLIKRVDVVTGGASAAWGRCRRRRRQSGFGQGVRGHQGQCDPGQRDRSQPAEDGAGRRLGHRFLRRPRPS